MTHGAWKGPFYVSGAGSWAVAAEPFHRMAANSRGALTSRSASEKRCYGLQERKDLGMGIPPFPSQSPCGHRILVTYSAACGELEGSAVRGSFLVAPAGLTLCEWISTPAKT